ncbi:MAG: DnaJ C-terminal domain-containing protein, partial [Acidimicrobiales bacterium]
GDAEKRKEYDEVLRMGQVGNPFSAPNGAAQGGATNVRMDDLGDLGDLIGTIFGRNARTTRSPGAGGPQRGSDLETALHLSFLDAVNGVTTTVNVVSDAPCATCRGSGAAPGTTPVVCNVCSGRGVINDNQGLFSFSQPCSACAGTGMRVEQPCPTCKGSGTQRRARQVKVRIPAGVENGQRIKVKGRGAAGRAGGPSGDLYVVVHADNHPLFGRRGKDLTVTVPVSFPEAALGAAVSVPTLDRPVTVRVPAGTPSGRVLRVRGYGVASGTTHGDLLVTVEVDVPDALSDDQKAAVEALGDLIKGDLLRDRLSA